MAAIIFRFQSIDLRDHAIEWGYRSVAMPQRRTWQCTFIKIYDVKNLAFVVAKYFVGF